MFPDVIPQIAAQQKAPTYLPRSADVPRDDLLLETATREGVPFPLVAPGLNAGNNAWEQSRRLQCLWRA